VLALSGIAFAVLFVAGFLVSGSDTPDSTAADPGVEELGG
jgi:hypothetical protein